MQILDDNDFSETDMSKFSSLYNEQHQLFIGSWMGMSGSLVTRIYKFHKATCEHYRQLNNCYINIWKRMSKDSLSHGELSVTIYILNNITMRCHIKPLR